MSDEPEKAAPRRLVDFDIGIEPEKQDSVKSARAVSAGNLAAIFFCLASAVEAVASECATRRGEMSDELRCCKDLLELGAKMTRRLTYCEDTFGD